MDRTEAARVLAANSPYDEAWWMNVVVHLAPRMARSARVTAHVAQAGAAAATARVYVRDEPGPMPPEAQQTPVVRWSGTSPPPDVQPFIAELGPIARAGERVVRLDVEVDHASVVDVSLELGGLTTTVTLVGGVLLDAAPLQALVAHARGTRLALALLVAIEAGLVWFTYAGRHTWFLTHDRSLGLLGLGVIGVLGAALVATRLLSTGQRTSVGGRIAVSGAIGSLLLGQLALASGGAPSMEDVEALTSTGETARAIAEARAAYDLKIEPERAAQYLDGVRAVAVEKDPDLQRASALIAEGWLTADGQAHAQEVLFDRVERSVRADQGGGNFSTTTALLGLLAVAQLQSPRAQALRLPADLNALDTCVAALNADCFARAETDARRHGATDEDVLARRRAADALIAQQAAEDWKLASSSKQPPAERLVACSRLRPLAGLAAAIGTGKAAPSTRSLDRTCAAAQQAAEAAQAAEERRAQDQARAAQRSARSRDYAPLLCNDGSYSPTCVCGGSRRGCCSWHGGVAGCSAD